VTQLMWKHHQTLSVSVCSSVARFKSLGVVERVIVSRKSAKTRVCIFPFVVHFTSGVTTDPADPAMRGGAQAYGGPKLIVALIFYCKFNAAIFVHCKLVSNGMVAV